MSSFVLWFLLILCETQRISTGLRQVKQFNMEAAVASGQLPYLLSWNICSRTEGVLDKLRGVWWVMYVLEQKEQLIKSQSLLPWGHVTLKQGSSLRTWLHLLRAVPEGPCWSPGDSPSPLSGDPSPAEMSPAQTSPWRGSLPLFLFSLLWLTCLVCQLCAITWVISESNIGPVWSLSSAFTICLPWLPGPVTHIRSCYRTRLGQLTYLQ